MERTLVILKPDAVQRGLLGRVTARLEDKGLKLVGCKMVHLTDSILDEHYAEHKGKPFLPHLKKFMTTNPVLLMAWEGLDAINIVRALCGATNGRQAASGTIRGDYSMGMNNLIHASDSLQSAEREIKLHFKPSELFDYRRALDTTINSEDELRK